MALVQRFHSSCHFEITAHVPLFTDPNGEGKGGSSDSESDGGSLDRHSLELASSHSSDDEDEFDLDPNWANQVPKSRAVELAIEQLEKMKKEKEQERVGNNNGIEEPALIELAAEQASPELRHQPPVQRPHIHPTPVPNPPDVTLSAIQQSGLGMVAPVRRDSLPHHYHTPHSPGNSPPPPPSHPAPSSTVQVLTHNGSISSDSESSETTV